MTPVIFRESFGEVTAVFPTLPADCRGAYMTCYAHTGQHSGCSHGFLYTTKPALPEHYHRLLEELVSIGYDDLKIYKRRTPQHRAAFLAALRAS